MGRHKSLKKLHRFGFQNSPVLPTAIMNGASQSSYAQERSLAILYFVDHVIEPLAAEEFQSRTDWIDFIDKYLKLALNTRERRGVFDFHRQMLLSALSCLGGDSRETLQRVRQVQLVPPTGPTAFADALVTLFNTIDMHISVAVRDSLPWAAFAYEMSRTGGALDSPDYHVPRGKDSAHSESTQLVLRRTFMHRLLATYHAHLASDDAVHPVPGGAVSRPLSATPCLFVPAIVPSPML
ncbi:hypothetical protein B0H14DRAFT_2616981 [Mycena olivaceomarginata]|nr:hypothetical protein B0H14DRAFT_2616981 [Mycena olivaceomarginata]